MNEYKHEQVQAQEQKRKHKEEDGENDGGRERERENKGINDEGERTKGDEVKERWIVGCRQEEKEMK